MKGKDNFLKMFTQHYRKMEWDLIFKMQIGTYIFNKY